MHDLNYFRDHLDLFGEMALNRGIQIAIDGFVRQDLGRRELINETEQMKARRNKVSDEIARLKKDKKDASSLIAEMKTVSEDIKRRDERIAQIDAKQSEFLLSVPNLPHATVPVGHSAADNKEVRRWGTPPKFDFQPKPHWEVGERAGILDLAAATKITGARFAVYKGWGARLERALASFFLDRHPREPGYTESRSNASETWFALSQGAALPRRQGLCLVKNIRHRSLVALQQRIPRDFFLLELRSVSIPPRRHSLQTQRWRQKRLRSHPKRFRARRWPHLDRCGGELSTAGWINPDS